MIEQLFGSKTRVKLLQLFYSNTNRSYYVREITRKIDEQINSVRRELSNLLSIGIITSDNTNNKLYYEVNQKYKYYEPLHQIFGGGVRKIASKKDGAVPDEQPSGVESDLKGSPQTRNGRENCGPSASTVARPHRRNGFRASTPGPRDLQHSPSHR